MKRALAILVVLLVAAAGFFYYRHRTSAPMPGASIPDLVLLAPAESSAILYADVTALRASPFLKQLIALLPPVQQDKEYEEFVRSTGFDYTRDLDQVLLALRNSTSGKLRTSHFAAYSTFVFAVGRFDRERIISYAFDQKLSKDFFYGQNDRDEYSVGSNGRILDFKFLSKDRIALAFGEFAQPPPSPGKKASPMPMETVFDSSFVSQPSPKLRERITRVSGSAFFAVGRVDPARNTSGSENPAGWLPDQMGGVVESLRWFTAAARPERDSLKVALEGECDGALEAQRLSLLLEAFRVLARSALKDPQTRRNLSPLQLAVLEHILQNAAISRDGARVLVRFELSSALLSASLSP